MMSAARRGCCILNQSIISIALPISPMPYATAVVVCGQRRYFQGGLADNLRKWLNISKRGPLCGILVPTSPHKVLQLRCQVLGTVGP